MSTQEDEKGLIRSFGKEQENINKEIIQRLMSKWNEKQNGNLEPFFGGFAENCIFRVFNNSAIPYSETSFESMLTSKSSNLSRSQFKTLMKVASDAFPDMRIFIQEMIAYDDRVMIQVINRGTHTGPWQNVKPTQKYVEYEEKVIFRLEDASIIEWFYNPDVANLYQQLGIPLK